MSLQSRSYPQQFLSKIRPIKIHNFVAYEILLKIWKTEQIFKKWVQKLDKKSVNSTFIH